MNTIIQSFLSKLSVIESKYRTLDDSKEQFNIFKALHKENDEENLHSRFLSVLLSPKSSHKKGNVFLKYFLQTVGIDFSDLNSVEVYPTECDKKEYRNISESIDILIINRKSKQAIIIENKIWAGDSKGQLERYFDFINREEKIKGTNIQVIYLTLDGHEPSKESLGKYKSLEKINGKTIDYEHEIKDWLNLCLKECVNQPFLRESIIQYINLIKHMTNSIDTEECIEIRDLIASSEDNMNSAKLLMDNFKHIKWHTVREFWDELAKELEYLRYNIITRPTDENIKNTTHYEEYKARYSSKNDYGISFEVEKIGIDIWNGIKGDWSLYWGIKVTSNKKYINAYSQNTGKFNTDNDFIWKYFDLEDNEKIYLQDFSRIGTFNLIDKKYRENIIKKKLIPEIKQFVKEINKLKMKQYG